MIVMQDRQLVELARERRLLLLDLAQHPRDLPDLGAHPGRGDDHLAPAARHGRVHVGHVEAVAERHVVAGDRRRPTSAPACSRRSARPPRSRASRPRAGARPPGSCRPPRRMTMSPGTSSSAGMSTSSPSRRTCALMMSIFWSAATLSAALPSWLRPRTALSTVRPMITMPVRELLQRDDADDRGAEQDELHQVAVLAQERPPARLLLRLRELVRADLRPTPLDLGGVEPVRGSTPSCAQASSAVRPCNLASRPACGLSTTSRSPKCALRSASRIGRQRRRSIVHHARKGCNTRCRPRAGSPAQWVRKTFKAARARPRPTFAATTRIMVGHRSRSTRAKTMP